MRPHHVKVLDESKVRRVDSHTFTGAVVEHWRLSGAHVSRIMHPPGHSIAAHGHDWPALILCRVGGYRETAEHGASDLEGPGVVFQPAGAAHADEVRSAGLETVTMTFDPAWVSAAARAALPARIEWRAHGPAVSAARALLQVWLAPDVNEAHLRAETSRFLETLTRAPHVAEAPRWTERLHAMLDEDHANTRSVANDLDRCPAWLARAYRAWRGEGIVEMLRRRRVERATLRLRSGADALADIALACGFCDQSHMNRSFQAVLGRTPLEVRREAALLAPLTPVSAAAG